MVGEVTYRFATFVLDTNARRLLHEGKVIHLAPRDFALLEFLVENTGRVLDRESILKTVWHDRTVEDGNLTQSISILRHVLGTDPGSVDCIETIPKHGYRFTLPVKRIERIVPSPQDRRLRRMRWFTGTAFVVAAILGGYWLGLLGWPKDYLAVNRLGILPMQNLSGNPRLDYTCEETSDDLAASLSSIPNLGIVLVQLGGVPHEEHRFLARRLGLDAVLSSTLRPCGEALCVSAHLDHAKAPAPIWTAHERIPAGELPVGFPNLASDAYDAVSARVP